MARTAAFSTATPMHLSSVKGLTTGHSRKSGRLPSGVKGKRRGLIRASDVRHYVPLELCPQEKDPSESKEGGVSSLSLWPMSCGHSGKSSQSDLWWYGARRIVHPLRVSASARSACLRTSSNRFAFPGFHRAALSRRGRGRTG